MRPLRGDRRRLDEQPANRPASAARRRWPLSPIPRRGKLGDVVGRGVRLDARELAQVVDRVRGVAADNTEREQSAAVPPEIAEQPGDLLDRFASANTKLVRDAIQQFSISAGIALVNSLHTTCALFINESQSALMDDLKRLIEQLVPERNGYCHDDPRVSDCERGHAHAYLRAALLGRTIAVGINNGELTLRRFQSISFAEFDGPRYLGSGRVL